MSRQGNNCLSHVPQSSQEWQISFLWENLQRLGNESVAITVRGTTWSCHAHYGYVTECSLSYGLWYNFYIVENKFKKAWNHPQNAACPTITNVYKIVESSSFLNPYDAYRYVVTLVSTWWRLTFVIGTNTGMSVSAITVPTASAGLGTQGIRNYVALQVVQHVPSSRRHSKLAMHFTTEGKSCFHSAHRKTHGFLKLFYRFGPGVYTSSASNKYVPSLSIIYQHWPSPRAANYTQTGLIFLNKVVLGKPRNVTQFNEVMSSPRGFNSVSLISMTSVSNLASSFVIAGCVW